MAPRRRREEGAGSACRARPHLCAAIWRREVPYRKRYRSIVRGFFWKISARQDSGVWECGLFASRVSASAAGSFIGSGRVIVREVPYGKQYRSIVRGFFWEATRRRRELGAGSTRRASPHTRRAEVSMGGGTFCVCVSRVRMAPRRRREEGAGSACPHTRRASGFMGSGVFCVCRIPRKDGPAPQARIGCGFNPAGSARIYAPPMAAGRASPLLCRASPIRRARGVLWEVAAL